MSQAITLELTAPAGAATSLSGFQQFWARKVDGFKADTHCQACFRGKGIPEVNLAMIAGQPVVAKMDAFPFLYVCGLALGPRNELYRRNFHLPLKHAEGRSVSAITYNGFLMTATNAVLLPIPSLQPNQLKDSAGSDLPLAMSRCKNFQFGVEYFGYPGTTPRTEFGLA